MDVARQGDEAGVRNQIRHFTAQTKRYGAVFFPVDDERRRPQPRQQSCYVDAVHHGQQLASHLGGRRRALQPGEALNIGGIRARHEYVSESLGTDSPMRPDQSEQRLPHLLCCDRIAVGIAPEHDQVRDAIRIFRRVRRRHWPGLRYPGQANSVRSETVDDRA